MPGSTLPDLFFSAAEKIAHSHLIRINRVLYEVDGEVEPDDGALELYVDSGEVFLFDGASDGETLRVRTAPWEDPFAGDQTTENKEYVDESGRWVRVTVSDQAPYDSLINADVAGVDILENEFGRVAGVAIESSERTLWFVVQGDECRVYWASPLGYRLNTRFERPPEV